MIDHNNKQTRICFSTIEPGISFYLNGAKDDYAEEFDLAPFVKKQYGQSRFVLGARLKEFEYRLMCPRCQDEQLMKGTIYFKEIVCPKCGLHILQSEGDRIVVFEVADNEQSETTKG